MKRYFNLKISSSEETVKTSRKIRAAGPAALALIGVVGATTPASAQTQTIPLPAGLGCAFPLTITIVGEQPVNKVFFDKNGKEVRYLLAGRGTTNTYINADTGASITIKPSGGSVSRGTVNPDGTITYVATGFNGLVFFPTDVPAGPSTTLYIGRVVYTVDPTTGVFTLVGSSGRQTDICATLSPRL